MLVFFIFIFFRIISVLAFVFGMYMLATMISGAPYVPSSRKKVKKMVTLAQLSKDDVVMDFGSGDGRIVRAASQTGATCIGVELNPLLCWWSRIMNIFYNIKNATIRRENMWNTNLSEINVLMLYCIPSKMHKLQNKIRAEMKPGSRVISHAFTFPDWQFSKKDDTVYVYVV